MSDVFQIATSNKAGKLLEVTSKSIETTTEQNKKLGQYTFWMMVMTGVITVCTIVQVVVAFCKP
jgi:hypothetical protein